MSGGTELYGPQMVKQSCLPHGKSKEASGMERELGMHPSLYALVIYFPLHKAIKL